jgi:serine/threonine-protein kinase/endoribonuclease IRE1
MLAFYVLTKGKHPFGEEPDQLRNVLDGKPVYLNMVKDPPANDLISWMLSHEPKDRPLAEEALKHPYLASPEQQFKMLCEVANQREIKKGDVDSDVVQKLNTISGDWQKQIDSKVLNYLRIDFVTGKPHKYGPSWCECLRLIRNVNQHWYDISRQRPQLDEEFYLVDNPQKYFLNVFPNLPTDVHRIVRSSDWKERPNIKEYFQ